MARRTFRRAPVRRKLVWARQQFGVNVTNAVLPAFAAPTRVDVLDQFVGAYGAALIGTTVVRVRGLVTLSTADGNNVSWTVAAFIGDANDVVRGPNANDNYYDSNSQGKDYFLVEPFFAPDVGAIGLTGSEVVSRVIDVKAMRKLEEVSQRLIIDVSSVGTVVTTLNVSADLSILLMLP